MIRTVEAIVDDTGELRLSAPLRISGSHRPQAFAIAVDTVKAARRLTDLVQRLCP